MLWWLIVIAGILMLWNLREHYVDPEFTVTRPARNSVWLSKIDSEAPIGGNDDDYIRVLQAFYDKVYVPAATKPKDTDVETFLKSSDAAVPGVDPNAIRKIIGTSFHIERTMTAAAREEAQVKFTPSKNLEPKLGRDEVYDRTEQIYVPADSRLGELPEGLYAPVEQQETPRREGQWDDRSTSWTDAKFYGVCEGGECAKNVL